jgi:hypothetical protein
MSGSDPTAVLPIRHALDEFSTALDHLIKLADDGGLDDLDAEGLIEFAQELESVRNRIPLLDHQIVAAGTVRDVPGHLCQRSMVRVLASALRISAAEAQRRVRAADHLGPRLTMTGQPLDPYRPVMAEAQRRGELSPEQVAVIDTELRKVDRPGYDPAQVDHGEQFLVAQAATFGPEDLRRIAVRIVDAIDPDGNLPDDEHHQTHRSFWLRPASDGSFRGEFRLTPEVGHKLKTVLDSLATPIITRYQTGNPHTAGNQPDQDRPDQDGRDQDGRVQDGRVQDGRVEVEADLRTRPQRLHDALGQVCDRLLRSGTLPDTGGIPTTVIITIDADDLAARTGIGSYPDGTPVPARQVADLADQAGLAWCLRRSNGEVLTLGRSRRLASPTQTLALYARDAGCSFPGCDTEPAWCERHHIISWIDGGPTDLTNLTLLCRYHHHNFEHRGWQCQITTDGLPAWTPPTWIDRAQRPIVHPRIRTKNWTTTPALPTATDPP